MNQRIYVHRPCFALAISLACGIWLGTKTDVSAGLTALSAVAVFVTAVFTRQKQWNVWVVHALFVLLGVVSVSHARGFPPDDVAHLSYEQRRDITLIEGVVISDPFFRQTARGEKTSFELFVERVDVNANSIHQRGKVLVNVFRREDLRYGDRLRVSGKLHEPFDEGFSGRFSYRDYLKRNGVRWILSVKRSASVEVIARGQGHPIQAKLLDLRRKLQNILERYLSAFEAGVVQSLVLGGRYYIPDRTRELFVQTGTAHILAISGMNVGGMAFLVFLLLNVMRLPRGAQIFLTALVLTGYCGLTGASPSVVRATVMAVVMLAALLFERRSDTLNSLGLAALIILLFDPMSLFDIGFQLSFMGVFSIVYFYPKIYGLIEGRSVNRTVIVLLQALCISLAAWIGVLPLVAYYFQIVTPVSILANIPIIPFVSLLFMLGAGLLLTGVFCPPAGVMFAACIKIVLYVLMVIVEFFSRWPLGYFYVPEFHLTLLVVYYLVVFFVFVSLPCFCARDQADGKLHFLS